MSLAAASIKLHQPTAMASQRRVRLLVGVTNHMLAKHADELRSRDNPGPAPAARPPPTPTHLRINQLGSAKQTSPYGLPLRLRLQKHSVLSRCSASRLTRAVKSSAGLLMVDEYDLNLPCETSIRDIAHVLVSAPSTMCGESLTSINQASADITVAANSEREASKMAAAELSEVFDIISARSSLLVETSKLTNPVMKQFLKDQGLPCSGTRPVMTQRIVAWNSLHPLDQENAATAATAAVTTTNTQQRTQASPLQPLPLTELINSSLCFARTAA